MVLYESRFKGRTSKAVSYLAFAINFLLLIFAGAITGLGIWLIAENAVGILSAVLPSEDLWSWLSYGMIFTGIILLVTGCLGVSGFVKERRAVIMVHCGMLVVCFIGVALFVALPFWYKEELRKNLYQNMDDSLFNYRGESDKGEHSIFWNYVQIYHQCCGVDDEKDYQYIAWNYERPAPSNMFIPTLGNVTRRYPASCCRYYYEHRPTLRQLRKANWKVNPVYLADCYKENPRPNPPHSFETGCYRRMRGMLYTNMTLLGSVAVVVESVLILVFLLGCFVIAANTPREY